MHYRAGSRGAGVDGREVALAIHDGLQQYRESFIHVAMVSGHDAIGGGKNVHMGAINGTNTIGHPLLGLEGRCDSGEPSAIGPSNEVPEIGANS